MTEGATGRSGGAFLVPVEITIFSYVSALGTSGFLTIFATP